MCVCFFKVDIVLERFVSWKIELLFFCRSIIGKELSDREKEKKKKEKLFKLGVIL